MKIENETLYISRFDLDHILDYVANDIIERENYINATGEDVDELVLSECFKNGLEIELSLCALEDKIFKDIIIEDIYMQSHINKK